MNITGRYQNLQQNMDASHEHGAADQEQEVEAVLVREQRVPDPDDVRQEEFLG